MRRPGDSALALTLESRTAGAVGVGMSSTTLYVIEKDGTLSEWTEYRNAHGVAPAIWHSLAAKYVPGVRPLGSKDYSGRDYLDREVSRELYRLAKTPGTMADFERRVYWTTHDRTAVSIENLPCYADAFAEFARVYGPDHERVGYVFHLGQMAEDMRKIYDERGEKGWRGVAWNQTSIESTWHQQKPTPEMKRRR